MITAGKLCLFFFVILNYRELWHAEGITYLSADVFLEPKRLVSTLITS